MFNKISSPISSVKSLVMHPIFIIAIAGILVRLMLFPIATVGYDSDFWATIIRNLNSGQGLYGLEGYYYTPVWGYILSFMSMLQGLFLNIADMGTRVIEAFPLEGYTNWFFSSTATTVSFNIMVKTAYLISDLLVGYLIYWLIKDKTGDTKKATIGFALWFLCPLVIGVTSVSGMFDTFSVLFILLCIVLVRKDKLFLAGIIFTLAVLTKFFPAYLLFPLLAYIIVMHREDGTMVKSLSKAAIGAALAFVVIMLPQIIHGDLAQSILFATNRMGGGGDGSLVGFITAYVPIIFYISCMLVSFLLAIRLSKKDKDKLDDSLFKYLFFMVAFIFLYPPTPQYLVLLIPFLSIYIVMWDSKFKWSWLIISLGGILFVFAGNFVLFLSLGTFTGVMSLDQIMSGVAWFQTPGFIGLTPMAAMYVTSAAIQYVGILSAVVMMLREKYIERKESKDSGSVVQRKWSLSLFR
ncbi:MAG: glycosyltransferase family 39 protein [Candidatus Methanoplasma sp.]|nr:glycosyltransferase family 39 protein [Candidatus Methanoplasma sp.]